ncbi:hypothetical protein B0J12DRAFT_178756 [Macrophomina phaseolina]|uniref:Zn(2)-C6 fungal-type domain-containing protein n=1 Tax=Macrophomina phaseolina TaxID=35725 RepID=A0ABQ8GWC2_9PEZI|nr:hypothetical protein B0J12DRAFT_178756 [Macrophomina phaseolina]
MRNKQVTVCHNCRARKLGCDGKRPSCTQCILTRRQCEGYQLERKFILVGSKAAVSDRKPPDSRALQRGLFVDSSVAKRPVGAAGLHAVQWPIGTTTIADYVAVTLNSYLSLEQNNGSLPNSYTNQVCGGWVEILPRLAAEAQPGDLLSAAITAIGASILDNVSIGSRVDYRSLEANSSALRQLRRQLAMPTRVFSIETFAAVGCLAMTELTLSSPGDRMLGHLAGLNALLKSCPPEMFSSGMFHSIFVGCRPVLFIMALLMHKTTFLAQKDWLRKPFRLHPPSDMQVLISDTAALPSVLERADRLHHLPNKDADKEGHQIQKALADILSRLSAWPDLSETEESDLPNNTQVPREQSAAEARAPRPSVHFTNSLEVNQHLYLWTFKIICLVKLREVRLLLKTHQNSKNLHDEILKLAIRICHSADYLLQDGMKLYGAVAVLFPLQIASEAFSDGTDANYEHLVHCKRLIERIHGKGIHTKPDFFQGSADGQSAGTTVSDVSFVSAHTGFPY